MSSTFVREIERSDESVLRIHQEDVGDEGVVVWDAALVLLFYLDKENDRQKVSLVRVVVWDAALVLLFYLDKENDRQKVSQV